MEFLTEAQEVDECLYYDPELIEKLSLSIKPDSLCQLLIYRSSGNVISEVDRQEISSLPEVEKLDAILERLKQKPDSTNASLKLLDCLRMTPFQVPSLPVSNTILWITPSAEYAAILIQTFNCSPELGDTFFWPVEDTTCTCKSSSVHYFLYRFCNVFNSFRVRVILVFPEGPTEEDMKHAVHGSTAQWRDVNLIVYSGLLSRYDPGYGAVIYRTSSCTPDLLQSLDSTAWKVNDFSELQKEFDSYKQMIWLAKLYHELENVGKESVWLKAINWTGSRCEEIIAQNLKDWDSKELLRYLLRIRLWSCDCTSTLGVTPTQQIKQTIGSLNPPPTVVYSTCEDSTNFMIKDMPTDQMDAVVLGEVPKLMPVLATAGLMPAEVLTPTFRRLAIEKCCKFTIQCLLYLLKS